MSLAVIAHRGASGTRPENTLAAFRRAVELGAHMIELDVQRTRDGEVVVIHDDTLERTTSGRGRVTAQAFEALRGLDAGAWFGAAYAGERIPTLAEVFAAVPLPVNVELKSAGDDGLERLVLEVVRRGNALGRVVFSSFDPESLMRLRSACQAAELAVLWSSRRISGALRVAERVRARALHVRKEAVAPAGMREAAAAGLVVRAWTVNDPTESDRFEALGVRAVFTDFPERFLQS